MNRTLRYTFAWAVGITAVFAQNPNQNPPGAKSSYQAAVENARLQFQGKNTAGAETTLFASNVSAPGTGAWFFESGQRLLWLAGSFLNHKDSATARTVAIRAIAYLTTAENKLVAEKKISAAARAQESVGRLYEQVLFDDANAVAAFQRALALDATSGLAKAALQRHQTTDAALTAKLQPHGD